MNSSPAVISRVTNVPLTAGFESVTLYEVIGTGAYGCVFKAKWGDLVCAAKRLHQHFCDERSIKARYTQTRSVRRRFLDEIELMASLRHPNIVQYLGVATVSNVPILLMELVDESLTHFLDSKAPLALPIQLGICMTSPWPCRSFIPTISCIEISPATMSSCLVDNGLNCLTLAWLSFTASMVSTLCVLEL